MSTYISIARSYAEVIYDIQHPEVNTLSLVLLLKTTTDINNFLCEMKKSLIENKMFGTKGKIIVKCRITSDTNKIEHIIKNKDLELNTEMS